MSNISMTVIVMWRSVACFGCFAWDFCWNSQDHDWRGGHALGLEMGRWGDGQKMELTKDWGTTEVRKSSHNALNMHLIVALL